MIKRLTPRGFLLISAIIIIVIVGFLGATIAYIVITNSRSMASQQDSARAFYIAESGLRRALYGMMEESISCSDISGDAAFTNVSFGDGRFTVTADEYYPNPPAMLTWWVGAADTVIPINSLSGYAPIGRVIIDNEAIDYNGTSTSVFTCSWFPPCLTNVTRGAAETTATVHSWGRWVMQNQCTVTSKGGVTNLTNPIAERQIQEDVLLGFGGGWIAGDSFSTETILGWNGMAWLHMGPYAGIPNVRLKSVYINTLADAWMVGYRSGGTATILRWNGLTWSLYPVGTTPNENLYAVTCLDSNDCWVVGNNATFSRWRGFFWARSFPDGSVPTNKAINSLSCMANGHCWGVGDVSGDSLIVYWNGTVWSRVQPLPPALPKQNLNSVMCIDTDDCWAVGNNSTILHYAGGALTNWTQYTASGMTSTPNFNSVNCVTPTDCWIVGASDSGTTRFVHWDSISGWTGVTSPGLPNSSLNAVDCADANDCWAVGDSKSLFHWNGSEWASITPDPSVPNVNLYSLAFIINGSGRLYHVR